MVASRNDDETSPVQHRGGARAMSGDFRDVRLRGTFIVGMAAGVFVTLLLILASMMIG